MNEKVFKVIFVGDLRVGKTSFIIKFTQNKFSPNYKPTLGGKVLSRGSIRFCRPCVLLPVLLLMYFCSGLRYNRSSTHAVRSC